MASAYEAETVAMALLAAHATFSGVTIVHQCEDTDAVSTYNRLIVACAPETTLLAARRPGDAAKVLQAEMTITGKTTGSETVFKNWRAAIDAAIGAWRTTDVGAAADLFENGIEFLPAINGSIDQEDQRVISRTFTVVWEPFIFS